MSYPNTFLSFSVAFFALLAVCQSTVPASQTFKYTNQGEFGPFIVEYDGSYRTLPIATFPFQFCFYNTTPNAFILGLRMASTRSESLFRWVWDANRGKPVKENATLTFGSDGNLVLADAGGKVAWQTGTAGKGVVGSRILPNGNFVLYNANGGYVWQSFDHPTDTLFVGQALKATGPTRLVSRLSDKEPVDGPYSFVMEKVNWALYYQTKNAKNPLPYYKSDVFGDGKGSLNILDFYVEPVNDDHAFELGFRFNLTGSESSGSAILTRPKYNSTYSILRIGLDGNLKIFTYDQFVDYQAWEVTYVVFDRDEGQTSECKLPRRCGSLGVCEDDQCVACPKPKGLFGWDKSCAPPPPPSCKAGAKVEYYKVDGVDHYTGDYNAGNGPLTLNQCKDQCTKDCKCLGLFYRQESSKCLLVPDLGTLVKVQNSSHAGYIKVSK